MLRRGDGEARPAMIALMQEPGAHLPNAAEALAAARKAVAEGNAIIAAMRQRYRMTGRLRPGPLARQFRPAPKPEPEGPDYFLTDREQDDARGARVMLRLARLVCGSRMAFYRAAGGHLEALRRHRDRAEWAEIIRHECALRPSRAYELMALARGDRTLEALRKSARDRQRKSRDKSTAAKTADRESSMIPREAPQPRDAIGAG